jgi:hypothetical protein
MAAGNFVDCYVVEVAGIITQQALIVAFYTSPLFKLERTMLKYLAASPASDAVVHQLAAGKVERFSAWRVERQTAAELLLADITGRTRSWLMAVPVVPVAGDAAAPCTLLYFGSAVVPRTGKSGQKSGMGWLFHALAGFHRLYSRLLLGTAGRRVGAVK